MKVNLEYVWIGGNGEFRSKHKILTLDKELTMEDIPEWNFDGSSTGQSKGEDTEVLLKPCINPYTRTDLIFPLAVRDFRINTRDV